MLSTIESRVHAIREWLLTSDLDALIIPHEDEFLGEYLPARNERLLWATGFTGSAGVSVITKTDAAIFVDGRYTVQVQKQVPADIFEYRHLVDEPIQQWLANRADALSKVAFDARLHTGVWLQRTKVSLPESITLVPLESNPIDALWQDRPDFANSPIRLLDITSVGINSLDKRNSIAQSLREQHADTAIITQLDAICWLLNIRGLDVPRLPVVLSHALLYSDGSLDLFVDPSRVPDTLNNHVGVGVQVYNPKELENRLHMLKGKNVIIDPSSSNAWFEMKLIEAGATITKSDDPCSLQKAVKNSVEIDGMKACHIRDGASMVTFLHWLDNEVEKGQLHDEAVLSDKLEQIRRLDDSLVDLSFDTISAAGDNAAMCHYNHNDQEQPGRLTNNSLYLVDSGGQYLNGTTDITRTIAIGEPNDEMKKQFTLVLKGHISLSSALFPKGTSGHQLDALARQHLWQYGFDFDHGTGHGVGHFLSVHEGPQSISKRPITVALQAGMVVSNEPGYYRADHFGIRIENLELVVEKETGGDFVALGFESLTRCPIDKRNIVVSMLTDKEVDWLNKYHRQVWNDVSPLVSEDAKIWLSSATSPITPEDSTN
ncbi:aminopeptidase P family protein [Vibrio sp. 99-8-1]|uniref:aminopeptidase P family protein n=1 Tax=Vibrio sp. 99-8-1 TaxID=2607602 RepID=UPI0014935599|nr:aminopeptidase P family protein [Vibrio sp. 99-8-1]NOI68176.1 aminopeptidase P family protein [Vibrio sp. 99-8-1]